MVLTVEVRKEGGICLVMMHSILEGSTAGPLSGGATGDTPQLYAATSRVFS